MSQANTAPAERETYGRYDPRLAGAIAYDMARHGAMTTGDIAELRRMNPERPAAASFWTFMMRHGVTNPEGAEPDHPELEKTWARIVRCIAMDTKVGENHTEGPHLGNRSLGEALANASYSEERLKALLNAKDETMLKAVEHAAHFLSSKQEKFNWNQGAALMMTEHRRSEQQDGDRVRIARDYYRAVNNRGQKE